MEEIERDEEGEGGVKEGWREWEREGEEGSNGGMQGRGSDNVVFYDGDHVTFLL